MTLGDLILDVVASATGPLAEGSDRSGRIVFRQGGSAANAARWVAASGAEAVFVGAIGRDDWGGRLDAALRGAGVIPHLIVKRAATARIVAIVLPDGERTFVTDRGAADLLVPSDLRRVWFAKAGALHLPAYALYNRPLESAARRSVELARAAGAIVSVDLASRQPILDLGPAEARRRVLAVAPDILFANAAEAEAILEGRSLPALLDLAPIVVVKQGGAGCRVVARRAATDVGRREARAGPADSFIAIEIATTPVAATDTTGAGDAFAAGFLVRWLASGHAMPVTAADLRRAALAGHRTARRLLSDPARSTID